MVGEPWTAMLAASPVPWLLEPEDPAVRAMTLERLCHDVMDHTATSSGGFGATGSVKERLLGLADQQGRWKNRYAYAGKTTVPIEKQGQTSKWVTLRACTLLQARHGN